jgi:cytoskeletal protein CcmA (bactofilin family)
MFSKQAAPKPGLPAMAKAGAEPGFSILGADLVLRGSLSADADLHIDGTIEGDLACRALVQGEASTITGSINAQSVRLAGTVAGPIEAAHVVILRGATVRGDIRYDALTVEQGAHVEGHLSRRDGSSSQGQALLG